MKKEKKIFIYAVFKDLVTLKYKAVVFSGQCNDGPNVYDIWLPIPRKNKYAFNFSSVRQAKKFIRQAFCDERAPEYACIVVDDKIKGIWWTHTKKHIETITTGRFMREFWSNSGTVAADIFKGLWDKWFMG